MATFLVHTDKENETPLHRSVDKSFKGKSLQRFPKNSNKLTQPTPRKALGSVNQDLPPSVKGSGLGYSAGPVEALFKSKNSVGDENFQAGHFVKKSKTKRSPVVHTGLKHSFAQKQTCKTKLSRSKQKPAFEPIPTVPHDVEYDSDTIFPRADRLSNYVDKLLTWRPPCLFGHVPDSDSDMSDVDDNLNQSLTLDEIPIHLEVDDQALPHDLSELLVDLPPLSPINLEMPPLPSSQGELVDQSLDSSLHLGGLHLNTSDLEASGDLGLGDHNTPL